MASVSGSTVSIDRGYFETLVRRAQFKSEPDQSNSPLGPHRSISIPEAEYGRLCGVSRQYENLRRNLMRGGVGEETIDLLSQDDSAIQAGKPAPAPSETTDANADGGVRLTVTPVPAPGFFDAVRSASNGHGHGNGLGTGHGYGSHNYGYGGDRQQDTAGWADADVDGDDVSFSMETPADGVSGQLNNDGQTQRPRFDRQCTRTVLLMNLPEGTTHADITAVVRGGILLDVFVRSHDRSATVSFLNAVDARGFFDHVRRHDLYIRNKRVEVRWNERQFILPGHVAGKIGNGATRNLIIRRCGSAHTEESIRDDLEHIHNLAVIKVEFASGDCYIRTNSVHNAMFARTCMMSRQKYKGSKIEWDVDECAQPFSPVPAFKPRKEAPAPKKANSTLNRFQLLTFDDSEEDEISSAFQSKKVGVVA